jgi:hypothetical protein
VPRTSYALKTALAMSGSTLSGMSGTLVVLLGRQHAEVPTASATGAGLAVVRSRLVGVVLPGGPDRASRGRSRRPRGLTDCIGEREQIIALGLRVDGLTGQPDDLPAPGSGESLGVLFAEVVGVRLGIGRQRAENGRLVGVHIRERADSLTLAGGTRTTTSSHE